MQAKEKNIKENVKKREEIVVEEMLDFDELLDVLPQRRC